MASRPIIFVVENWHKLKTIFLVGSALEISKYYKDNELMRKCYCKEKYPLRNGGETIPGIWVLQEELNTYIRIGKQFIGWS